MKRIILALITVFFFGLTPELTAQEVEVRTEKKTEMTKAQKDSILYEKLSPDQLVKIKEMEMMVEKQRIEARSGNDLPLSNFSIILIVMTPFLFVIGIVLINVRSKQSEAKRRYEIYMKSLEMGQPIPSHLFDEPSGKKSSNLKRGIISLMVGLAFGVYVIVDGNTSLPFLLAALIPGLVGVGYILVHKLEKPKTENAEANNEQS
jgi:hypothetical protein